MALGGKQGWGGGTDRRPEGFKKKYMLYERLTSSCICPAPRINPVSDPVSVWNFITFITKFKGSRKKFFSFIGSAIKAMTPPTLELDGSRNFANGEKF